MKHTFLPRIGFLLALVLVPSAVSAAAPTVTGITAQPQGNDVLVQWQPAAGDTLAYQVYWSRQSIVGNNGAYDDFETIGANQTQLLLTHLPQSGTYYVSVSAVQSNGQIGSFVEEAVVTTGTPSDGTAGPGGGNTPPGPESVGTPTDLELLSAASLSATGVLLTFNTEPVVPQNPNQAVKTFLITDSSGTVLQATNLYLLGNTMTITTVPQHLGMAYRVAVSSPLQGRLPGSSTILPLSIDRVVTSFVATSGLPPLPPGTVQPITTVHLTAQALGKGVYRVVGTWMIPGNPDSFLIRQTRDGGRTFSEAQRVPGTARRVTFQNVTGAASFGISVQAIRAGQGSRVVSASIELPAAASALPGSGPAADLALVVMTGMLAGFFVRRSMPPSTMHS